VLWEEERAFEGRTLWFGHASNYTPVYAHGAGLQNRLTPAVLGVPFRDGVLADVEAPL
jgi:hypothetical protein